MVTRGWSYFIVGLLLSSFLGGAVRVFFSPPRIRAWVEEVASRKQPKFTLEFKEARLAFADSWKPGVAVEFIDLRLRARDQCITGSEVLIDRLNLPIQASAIFSQKVKFGVVGVEHLQLKLNPSNCESTLEIPKVVESLGNIPPLVRLENFMKDRWRREVQNTMKLLDGVQIERLTVLREEEKAPLLTLEAFRGEIIPEDDVAILEFSLEPGVSIVGHQHVGRLRSHLSLSPELIQMTGRGNLKEGQYLSHINWDVKSGFWDGQLEMRDMPASSLVSLLGQWEMLKWPNFNPRNQWFRCDLKSEGSLVAWRASPVRFESCGFYGELGDIQVRAGESRIFEGQLYPISADFRNVSMGPILMQFGQLRQWIGQEGLTNGELKINDEGSIAYNGIWREPQFQIPGIEIFRIGGISIDQMKMHWDYNAERSILKLSEPTAYGEDFDFEMQVTDAIDVVGTEIQWSANWPEWPKAMTKLTDIVVASGFKTQGNAQLGSRKPMLELKLLADEFNAEGVRGTGFQSRFQFLEGKGEFSASTNSLALQDSSSLKLIAKMLKLSDDENLPEGEIRLTGEFDQEGRWVVNPFTINISNIRGSRAEFVGRGFKLAVDQGIFRLYEKTNLKKQFNVFGSIEEPRFELQ